jgi:hypothetical protein
MILKVVPGLTFLNSLLLTYANVLKYRIPAYFSS